MGISREQAETLVNQVQQSHRLLAGFYKRILPAIDNLASQFGASFWYWKPTAFDRPCGSSTRPSSKWAWDFLPLVAATLVYVKNDDGEQKSDLMMEFQLRSDPAVLREERLQKGQPDPTALPDIEPSLRVFLFRPAEGSEVDLKSEWEMLDYSTKEPGVVTSPTENIEAMWLETSLADFIHSPHKLEAQIASFAETVKTVA